MRNLGYTVCCQRLVKRDKVIPHIFVCMYEYVQYCNLAWSGGRSRSECPEANQTVKFHELYGTQFPATRIKARKTCRCRAAW